MAAVLRSRPPRPARPAVITSRWLIISLLATAGLGLLPGCAPAPTEPTVAWSNPVEPSASETGSPAAEPSAPPSPSASPSASRSASAGASSQFKYTFPVSGNTSYARTHHDYPAADMMAACGLQFRAPVSGVVLETDKVDKYSAAKPLAEERGGISVSMLGDDGVRYYGSHLGSVQAGIDPGVRVASGDVLGLIGKSGNASACHLHFGISPACQKTGDWWLRRGAVYPWPYLDSWRAKQTKSPVTEVAAWQRQHGCPSSPPAGY